MIQYRYNSAKTLDETKQQPNEYFFVNALVEKRKYIYFRRGPFGTPNYECGMEHFKMKKRNFRWEKVSDRECSGGMPVYKVERI